MHSCVDPRGVDPRGLFLLQHSSSNLLPSSIIACKLVHDTLVCDLNAMITTRILICLFPLVIVVSGGTHQSRTPTIDNNPSALRSWSAIAKETGTDKHAVHMYQHVYEEMLEPFRSLPIRFMEIGLGCDMKYGPGRSFKLWDEYFTNSDAQLHYMERDGACVSAMNIQPRNGHIFVGSQDNITFLQHTATRLDALGGLDVLVDDGGHTMSQQLTTFETFWPHMRPGGLYVVEDVQTSYIKAWGGSRQAAHDQHSNGRATTFMGRITELLDALNCDYSPEECDTSLQGVYCFHHACALRKAGKPGDKQPTELRFPTMRNPHVENKQT